MSNVHCQAGVNPPASWLDNASVVGTRPPIQGVGIGLRSQHFHDIITTRPPVPWFEALADNYLDLGSLPFLQLQRIREDYPIALHSVGLSLGGTDPLCHDYLKSLQILSNRIEASVLSDHACWTAHQGQHLHELMPLPYTEEVVNHLVERISQVQDYLQKSILIENVSSYVAYRSSTLQEWDFLNQVCDRSGCGLLLDINNVYVSAKNHGFDPYVYLEQIDPCHVKQFHMAGHTDMGPYLLDSHGAPVTEQVWSLYQLGVSRFPNTPTLFEWDNAIPELSVLLEEREIAMSFHSVRPVCS